MKVQEAKLETIKTKAKIRKAKSQDEVPFTKRALKKQSVKKPINVISTI